MKLREQITASTNKVEAYNGFSKWLFFGGDGIITENDPVEQEKRIKYNDLVANAVIFQNVVDITMILWQLKREGYRFSREDLVMLSPYRGPVRKMRIYNAKPIFLTIPHFTTLRKF